MLMEISTLINFVQSVASPFELGESDLLHPNGVAVHGAFETQNTSCMRRPPFSREMSMSASPARTEPIAVGDARRLSLELMKDMVITGVASAMDTSATGIERNWSVGATTWV